MCRINYDGTLYASYVIISQGHHTLYRGGTLYASYVRISQGHHTLHASYVHISQGHHTLYGGGPPPAGHQPDPGKVVRGELGQQESIVILVGTSRLGDLGEERRSEEVKGMEGR